MIPGARYGAGVGRVPLVERRSDIEWIERSVVVDAERLMALRPVPECGGSPIITPGDGRSVRAQGGATVLGGAPARVRVLLGRRKWLSDPFPLPRE